jgi:hypothetical protein
MSDYSVFTTERGELVIIEMQERRVLAVARDDVDDFVAKVLGALPPERTTLGPSPQRFRRRTRP